MCAVRFAFAAQWRRWFDVSHAELGISRPSWVMALVPAISSLIVVTFPDDAGLHVPTDGCDNVPCRLVLRLIAWRVPIGSHPCALDCLHLHEDRTLDWVRVEVCAGGPRPFGPALAGLFLVGHERHEGVLVADPDRAGRGGLFYDIDRVRWPPPQAEPFVSLGLEVLAEGVGVGCA